jgi:hypothetical protein
MALLHLAWLPLGVLDARRGGILRKGRTVVMIAIG